MITTPILSAPKINIWNIFLGLILGVIFSESSQMAMAETPIYMFLGILFYIIFFKKTMQIQNVKMVSLLILSCSLMWLASLLLNFTLSMITWKISTGMMWLMLSLILISDPNKFKVNYFTSFLLGFGLSFLIMTIIAIPNATSLRMSFKGDPIAPHVFASALILTGSAMVTISSSLNSGHRNLMLLLGAMLIIISLLTLSKTSFLAVIFLFIYALKNHKLISTIFLFLILILLSLGVINFPEIDLSRVYTFRLSDASIGERLNLFLGSLKASLSYFGMPGYFGYPKNWIDSSLGSIISTFGLIGAVPLFLIWFSKKIQFSFGLSIFVMIFLTTEHLILPRILLPACFLIYSISFISWHSLNYKANLKATLMNCAAHKLEDKYG